MHIITNLHWATGSAEKTRRNTLMFLLLHLGCCTWRGLEERTLVAPWLVVQVFLSGLVWQLQFILSTL